MSTTMTAAERRTLVALACKVAWADGVVEEAERGYVRRLAQKFGADAVSAEEVDHWLTSGAPEAFVESLPENVGQMFFYEAMNLMESDGEIDDTELRVVSDIMSRVFARHPENTPFARMLKKTGS